LFDFGLAKEVVPWEKTSKSPCNSSGFLHIIKKRDVSACVGNTGTTRYMAPEIILREHYGTEVDIFSAGIVCWEVMTLTKPYGNAASANFIKQCVALYDHRPTLPEAHDNSKLTPWPKSLLKLVQQGWSKDPAARPTAQEMRRALEAIVDKKQQELSTASSFSSTSTSPQKPRLRQPRASANAITNDESC
jgi:serine/threonine protein kinase